MIYLTYPSAVNMDTCTRCGKPGHPESTPMCHPEALIVNGLCFDCFKKDALEDPVEALL